MKQLEISECNSNDRFSEILGPERVRIAAVIKYASTRDTTARDAATRDAATIDRLFRHHQDTNSSDNMKGTEEYWRNALTDGFETPFPAPPSSAQDPVADSMIEYAFQSQGKPLQDIVTSNTIRAAWALVTGRMTSSDDVVFGVALPGRSTQVIGINEKTTPRSVIIPVRMKLARDQRVADYLEAVQMQAMHMMLLEQTELQRISKTCLVGQQSCIQTLLIIRPSHIDSTQDGSQPQKSHPYALVLEFHLGSGRIVARASFDSRTIDTRRVQELLEALDFTIHQLCGTDSEQTLADIHIVTNHDVEAIWKWNGTVPAPAERCVHEMIEERARIQPHAPAVRAWDGDLTYSELDQLATELAGHLTSLGVRSDILVPLCFEKSMWATVAMLGVLKAGGGFVFLDSSLPVQRLRSLVQQIKAGLVLASPSTQPLSARLGQHVVPISSDFFQNLCNQTTEHPLTPSLSTPGLRASSPSSVLYVVFTSGSTGTPKGVEITHQNVASAVRHQAELFEFTTQSRIFDFAAYSYDVSISTAIATLATGGCLCVPSDQDRRSNLPGSIALLGANVVVLTPSIARLLSPEEIPKVQLIILVGEALSPRDIQPWWNKVRFIHRYGVSECPAASTINSGACSVEEAARIGKGAGLVTWVVDQENHDYLLPVGAVGELLLEGPLVSQGYLGDPEKTASKFIYDPVWLSRGAPGRAGRRGRLYKTGDLVRYNEDGSLTFIGRKDTQVKIHGQRVELGEVEYRVQECILDARQVVAEIIMPQGSKSSPVLAAFLQLKENRTPEIDEPVASTPAIFHISSDIRAKLAEHLPSYMVPAVFLAVRELPMTATGKTDRRRLREIGGSFTAQQL